MTISPELYRHPLDQQAFDALNSFPQFSKIKQAYLENTNEIFFKINLLSDAIRINSNQFPKIYNLLPPICEKLGINEPDIFYVKSNELNAFTGGNKSPYICVTSRIVNELPPELISSVLAHECGHIACQHYLYHSLAMLLVKGIDNSPLRNIKVMKKVLTPTVAKALLFWDRCSELSADRAAVLCDGGSENFIDSLLKINGYKNINRDEFINQAMDLKKLVNESPSNKLMEFMLIKDDTHPRLATRASECYEWAKSDIFKELENGTYSPDKSSNNDTEKKEVITAEMNIGSGEKDEPVNLDTINASLDKINGELKRYTNEADKLDYSIAISSGILAGIIDALYVGKFDLTKANEWGGSTINDFVLKAAQYQGYKGNDLSKAVKFLEEAFPIAADKATNDFGGGLQHHLRDFSHHPTPVGLICSILTQFTGNVYGTDKTGAFKSVALGEDGLDLIGKNIPEKITFGTINWFFHMVSDMAGSSGSIMDGSLGTGLPGPIVSLLKEISSTPVFKSTNADEYRTLSVNVSKLFNGTLLGDRDADGKLIPLKFDLRTEMGIAHMAGRQAVPVIINECIVRAFYFIRQLITELKHIDPASMNGFENINWKNTLPFKNRTVDRMLTISTMTFNIADTADAAIHAAIDSSGSWVLFSGIFVSRYNYVGAGRSILAVIKECSNEKKEAELIHEKMILSEAKAQMFFNSLQKFKSDLEEKVSNYLAEDIEEFCNGFDFINKGLDSGNSDLVIKGSIKIQKVLGREPQFSNQKEFDDLMSSDDAFIL